jgi:hypothetical protein
MSDIDTITPSRKRQTLPATLSANREQDKFGAGTTVLGVPVYTPPPSKITSTTVNHQMQAREPANLAEKLFDDLITLKVHASQVSMHLDASWRARLYAKLDDLYDPGSWDEDETTVEEVSFRTFLRFVLLAPSLRVQSLGISTRGDLLAGWQSGSNVITLEFAKGDRVRWTVAIEQKNGREIASGEAPINRVEAILAAFRIGHILQSPDAESP